MRRRRATMQASPEPSSAPLAGRTGRAIAEACARAGARLVLADVRAEAGAATAAALAGQGHAVRFAPLDLADPASIAAFAAEVARREEVVHGLVNNAAIATAI